MKTTYTDEELQAAIDNAILLFGRENGKSWEQLAPNRLAIAKAFLEKLEPATPHKPVPVGYTLLQDGASEFEKLPESAMWLVKDSFSEWKTDSWFINNQVTELAQSQNWYAVPTPDPYAELKKAHAEGKAIQYQSANGSWHDLEDFNFCTLAENYRIKPEPDPYAALKKAHAEGKAIQRNIHSGIGSAAAYWQDKANADWSWPVDTYRIKPEPETFEAHGKTWTRHTPGDAMPCDRKAQVEVIYGADNEWLSKQSAQWWNWISGTITGWRYADESTPEPLATEPWTPAVGNVVALASGGPLMTARCYTPENAVVCDWFNAEGLADSRTFPATCLKLHKA